jgi:hypothetical protein
MLPVSYSVSSIPECSPAWRFTSALSTSPKSKDSALKMDGVGGLAGWRWLFIVEGCATVVVSVLLYFLLPDDFETAYFLNGMIESSCV